MPGPLMAVAVAVLKRLKWKRHVAINAINHIYAKTRLIIVRDGKPHTRFARAASVNGRENGRQPLHTGLKTQESRTTLKGNRLWYARRGEIGNRKTSALGGVACRVYRSGAHITSKWHSARFCSRCRFPISRPFWRQLCLPCACTAALEPQHTYEHHNEWWKLSPGANAQHWPHHQLAKAEH